MNLLTVLNPPKASGHPDMGVAVTGNDVCCWVPLAFSIGGLAACSALLS